MSVKRRPLSRRKHFRVTELLHRAEQYDQEAKTNAKQRSSLMEMEAEERRNAFANELMSRRHLMDQSAIEKAEKEMELLAPYLESRRKFDERIAEYWKTRAGKKSYNLFIAIRLDAEGPIEDHDFMEPNLQPSAVPITRLGGLQPEEPLPITPPTTNEDASAAKTLTEETATEFKSQKAQPSVSIEDLILGEPKTTAKTPEKETLQGKTTDPLDETENQLFEDQQKEQSKSGKTATSIEETKHEPLEARQEGEIESEETTQLSSSEDPSLELSSSENSISESLPSEELESNDFVETNESEEEKPKQE